MKKEIYETINGEREGFVVGIDYDKFLHWNNGDSSFIILSKGECNLSIYNNTLKIEIPNSDSVYCKVEEKLIKLKDLDESLYEYECEYIESSGCKIIIIKLPIIIEQLDLEGAIYVNNIFTAEKLVNHFCDRIDFNVELIVPLNNLRLLNDMIKNHHEMIKFVKNVSINNNPALVIITNYNASDEIAKEFNKMYVPQEDEKENYHNFINQCKIESGEIMNSYELNELMNLYAESTINPYDKVSRNNCELDNDEAYMMMYEKLSKES